MKSMILYSTRTANFDRQCKTRASLTARGETVFVRAEVVESDIDTALKNAKPRDGETVLNSIPLD